jgi:hypothetical protein
VGKLALVLIPLAALSAAIAACGEEEQVPSPSNTLGGSETPAAMGTTAPGSPSPSPEASPDAVPPDWQTYNDPVLGFSLRYPPDLVFKDVRGPSPAGGVNERAYQFRSPNNASRSFTISMSSNSEGRTSEEWLLDHAACRPDTIAPGMVDGQPATFCTSEPAEIPEAAIAFQVADKMLFITSVMPTFELQAEFDLVIASLQL